MSEADQNIGRDPMAGIDGEVCRYWGDANAKEEEWKQARWEYLSASWAGPLMETCPYHAKDADEAGLSMRDMLIQKFRLREDLQVNNAMRHGSYQEPIVIDLWSRITGIPMLRSNAMYVSTRAQNMSCTIDGFVLPDRDFPDAADVGYLEGARDPDEASEKQAWFWPFLERCYEMSDKHGPGLFEAKWKRQWAGGNRSQAAKYPERFFTPGPDAHAETFGCPVQHAWQVMAQMHVTGVKWCVLGCVIGGFDPRAWVVEYDPEAGAMLADRVGEFWRAFHGADHNLHTG